MLEFFDLKDSKVKFKNKTLNQILAVWILAGALPWSRIEDYHLRLAFWYIRSDIKIFGQTWVAREAAGMYTSLQDTVLKEILGSYTWSPKTDYAWCFLHKISCTVKGGLAELGQSSPSRFQMCESTLGVFPITGKLPVIAEEEEDYQQHWAQVINIDIEEHDLEVTPEEEDEYETDHDSQHEVKTPAPDYDEDHEDKKDAEDPFNTSYRAESLNQPLGGDISQGRQRLST
ncbi:uncharacterized protein MELLADRAFT_101584 [Melampsora larici-populina 98AG31]|uniref:Uncharacterized protein n=1 Tax=Melampsora larici-populina (strain 98AG31 / pathotype 3-4-7) TaxID=747676 RepID=F4R6B4_MELLP|nr:uncharacterized protein MELLADRAFT_101584 [Melampsora larici-populina 98AG31]EGG12492.1 hypothetical protein MELLADRAFT_101584 [Melampsora larici-populina 98AG31]